MIRKVFFNFLKKLLLYMQRIERVLIARLSLSPVLMSTNVTVVLTDVETGRRRVLKTKNIVTNAGDRFYAEQAVDGSLTNNFKGANSGFRLGTGVTAATKSDNDVTTFLTGSAKAIDATYPRTADPDSDNTGSGVNVATWRVTYGTTEANGSSISELAIVDNKTTPTCALMHALFSVPFTKTSSDTLKVIVNHTLLGA